MPLSPHLLLVGCGKMGGALLRGWVRGMQPHVAVVDPGAQPEDLKLPGITWHTSPASLDSAFRPDAVILAVKPQQMDEVLPRYAGYNQALFLSIAAGVTVERLEGMVAQRAQPPASRPAIIRAMPNLPACIGQGMSVAVASKAVTAEQRALGETLLHAGGEVAWVEEEGLLDAVTALSGSGPAYLFALAECMEDAGERLGLPPELAQKLARQTIIGSGGLLAQSAETPTALRQAVTSKGGTTEAALAHLLAPEGMPSLMLKAMRAAAERAKELSETISPRRN